MQGKTRAHKPKLELGTGKVTRRKKLTPITEVVEEIEVRIESCWNVEPTASSLLEYLEVDTQIERESNPCQVEWRDIVRD